MSASLAMSPCTPVTRPPICFTAASSASWRRPVTNTDAPSAANAFAVARPMPLVPPVTTTTLLLNRSVIVCLLGAAAQSPLPRSDADGTIDACSWQIWHVAFHQEER